MGELKSIVYKPQDATTIEECYTRLPLQEAKLVVGQGIDGDVKGSGNLARQLNIMTLETAAQLGEEGFQASVGQMGEQLMVSGIEVNALAIGTRLQIGSSAQLELTEPRTGCGKFERYQGKKREEASGRLGMMARVVAAGTIHVGDAVEVVETAMS